MIDRAKKKIILELTWEDARDLADRLEGWDRSLAEELRDEARSLLGLTCTKPHTHR